MYEGLFDKRHATFITCIRSVVSVAVFQKYPTSFLSCCFHLFEAGFPLLKMSKRNVEVKTAKSLSIHWS